MTWQTASRPTGRWLWPAVLGSPMALVVLFAFIVSPFIPLSHARCASVSSRPARSTRLRPTLAQTSGRHGGDVRPKKDDPNFNGRFDLTDEAEFAINVGGHLVGYRMYGETKGEPPSVMEGFFHLRQADGTWRIDDGYFTSFNNDQAPEPISLVLNYRKMFPEATAASPAPATTTSSSSNSTANKTAARGIGGLMRWVFGSRDEKVASSEGRALASEGSRLGSQRREGHRQRREGPIQGSEGSRCGGHGDPRGDCRTVQVANRTGPIIRNGHPKLDRKRAT